MANPWPELPYDSWQATRDTLHAHTQVLGKLAAALARGKALRLAYQTIPRTCYP